MAVETHRPSLFGNSLATAAWSIRQVPDLASEQKQAQMPIYEVAGITPYRVFPEKPKC
jgi:hypothetical protein